MWHLLLQGVSYFIGVDFNHLPLWISSSWWKAKGRGKTLNGIGPLCNACDHLRPQKYNNYSFQWHTDVVCHLMMFNYYLVLSIQKNNAQSFETLQWSCKQLLNLGFSFSQMIQTKVPQHLFWRPHLFQSTYVWFRLHFAHLWLHKKRQIIISCSSAAVLCKNLTNLAVSGTSQHLITILRVKTSLKLYSSSALYPLCKMGKIFPEVSAH